MVHVSESLVLLRDVWDEPQANHGKILVDYHKQQVLHMFLTAANEAMVISHSCCIRVV